MEAAFAPIIQTALTGAMGGLTHKIDTVLAHVQAIDARLAAVEKSAGERLANSDAIAAASMTMEELLTTLAGKLHTIESRMEAHETTAVQQMQIPSPCSHMHRPA